MSSKFARRFNYDTMTNVINMDAKRLKIDLNPVEISKLFVISI